MVSASVLTGIKATLVARVVYLLARGGLILVLTRVFFDSGEYGLLFFAISVFAVSQLFANLGVAKSGARYVAQYSERAPSQIPHIVTTAFTYRVITSALVGAVFLVFGPFLADLLGQPGSGRLLMLGFGYVVIHGLMTCAMKLFQGLNEVVYSAVINATASLCSFVAVTAFVAAGFGTFGALTGYIVGYAIATAVGLGLVYTKCYTVYERAAEMEAGLARDIRRYSVPLTATKGAHVLDQRIDTVLLGVLASPVAVGYYTLGKQVSSFAIAPAGSIGFAIAPTYGERKEAGDIARAARVYETTFEYVLTLYVPAAVGLVLIAEPLVRHVFRSEYLGAAPVIQVFGVFVLFQAIDKITADGLDFLGRSKSRAISKLVSACANFLLNLALIPVYGAVGAAVATVVTYALMVGVNLFIVADELPLNVVKLVGTAGRVVAVAAVMGSAVLAARPHVDGLFTLAGVVLLGVGVWSGLSVLVGVLDPDQVRSALS